jgi:SAM-dependent methyltransferase
VLDLCCGTGQITAQIADRGFQVVGIDASERMLDFARRNAPTAQFILADARDFSLDEPVSAVVCTSDSLSHVIDLAELGAVFRCVRRALTNRGLFIFDMNTEEKYRRRWVGSFGIAEDDQACMVAAHYDEATHLARFDATMFVSEAGPANQWRREDLSLTARCYTQDELAVALAEAGFADVAFFDWQRDLDPAGEPEKFFVLGRG